MNTLTVVNIKCGGCEGRITKALNKAGISGVVINIPEQKVSFEGEVDAARQVLLSLGYPEATSPEAASLGKKAHSYLSCAIGRITK